MSDGPKKPGGIKSQRRAIRTAEGYLELMSTFESGLSMDEALAQPIADRMLRLLENIEPTAEHRCYVMHLKGEACRFANRFEEAIVHFRKSLEMEPDSIHGLLAIAWCFKRVGRIDESIESMQIAIEFEPDQAICHYNLACYYALAGRTANAIEYLAQAFELRPSFRQEVDSESDFDAIRDDKEFLEFLSPEVA
ncbi:tetratricopeptide repeat protein [Mariniblastus fucicola]|uniref:Photosystem I assembly protein Ycf3 n=1 Tax=Mariniblastus fucicola TaxID=980251 RepID=A0A5B9P5C9_9BACT|nr:tetratricopeptide repeat protein [Mariniblastus fucicola]QEG20182.1 Photosystem I assembly protein Ycf3 [Mariniblastus fucicola]